MYYYLFLMQKKTGHVPYRDRQKINFPDIPSRNAGNCRMGTIYFAVSNGCAATGMKDGSEETAGSMMIKNQENFRKFAT